MISIRARLATQQSFTRTRHDGSYVSIPRAATCTCTWGGGGGLGHRQPRPTAAIGHEAHRHHRYYRHHQPGVAPFSRPGQPAPGYPTHAPVRYLAYQNVHDPYETAPEAYTDIYSNVIDENRRNFSALVTLLDEGIRNVTDVRRW